MSVSNLRNLVGSPKSIRSVSIKPASSPQTQANDENPLGLEELYESIFGKKNPSENSSLGTVFTSLNSSANNAWLSKSISRLDSNSSSQNIQTNSSPAGAYNTQASSLNLYDDSLQNSSSLGNSFNNPISTNSSNTANGADIQLPASATIPNPSEITSKTDPLVPNPSNIPLTEMEFEVIRLTNAARQEKGLPPLEARANLTETARESSAKMRAISSMEHGLTSGWGRENIAMGQRSAQEVVRAWLNSPGHYANIMSDSSYIGVGDTTSDGGAPYWTMQLS